MKRIYTFLAAVSLALSVMAATDFTFTTSDMTQTKDGFTVAIAQGSSQSAPSATTDYETKKPEMRLYKGNTITVSGTGLTNIQLAFAKSSASNKEYTGLSASNGTLVSGGESTDKNDWKIDTWTGNADEVVFTLTEPGKQRRIRQIRINGEPLVIEDDEAPLPTEDDLDWTYEYLQEPESVFPPDTNIFHKEYAFIDNNILVHCTQGSINKEEGEKPAAFSCMMGEQITFSATQQIVGIAVKGSLRKNHETSTSRGDISYIINEDEEPQGDPVLVVRNINALSVTLTCTKNVSFEEVKVYFEENPDPVGEEIDVPGETYFLDYDTASVELDTDESEEGKQVYTLYIWDKTNEWIYFGFEIITPIANNFVGTYSFDKGNMTDNTFYQYGEDYDDYSYATEGALVINKQNGLYSISGYITCENGNTYNVTFTGEIDGGEDEETGMESIQNSDVRSQKILRNGQLLIIRENKAYNVLGLEVR